MYASGVHSLKPHNEMVHAVTMNHNFGQSFENLRGFTHQGLQFSLGLGGFRPRNCCRDGAPVGRIAASILTNPKEVPMGKRVKKGKIMNKNRPVNKSNAASDQKRIRENAAVLKALNSA